MKRQLIRHLTFVTLGHYIAEALFLVRGLVLARLLGPVGFGVWSSMRLVLILADNAHLGTRQGMLQRAPQAHGAGSHARARRYRQAASGMGLLGAFTVSGALVGFVWWRGAPGGQIEWWYELAAILIAAHVYEFYQASLRSQQEFGLSSAAMVCFAAISTVAGVWAVLIYGLTGFLAALAASYVSVLIVIAAVGPPIPRPTFFDAYTPGLVRVGFPIMAAEFLMLLLWNIDKLFLWLLVGSQALGIYAVQAYIVNTVLILPRAISRVLLPHLAERLGREKRMTTVQPYLERGTLLLAQLACPVIGVLYLVLHLPIRWWLPEFAQAIAPGRILMLMTFFTITATVPATVLISLGAQRQLMIIRLFGVVLSAGALTYVLRAEGSFTDVAWATSLGLIVYPILAVGTAIRRTRFDTRRSLRFITRILLPFVLLLFMLWGVTLAIPDTTSSWQDDLWLSIIRSAIIATVFVPWAVWSGRRIGIRS